MIYVHKLLGVVTQHSRLLLSLGKVLALRLQGAHIGRGVKIYGSIYIDGRIRNLTIGDETVINHGVYINCRSPIQIGHRCNLSVGVKIISTGLDVSTGVKGVHLADDILIGNDVWIGCNSVVLKGACICDRVVVGASSLVVKSIITPGVYVGSPVRQSRVAEH